jgi:hypothetical protein
LLLYVFATLHKFNLGFLRADYSCAAAHYLRLRNVIPLLPAAPWATHFAIYSTLAVEGGIPLLLFFHRTRFYGVLLALLFHTVVGVNNYFDFSAPVYALLLLFVPYGTFSSVQKNPFALFEKWESASPRIFLPAAGVAAAAITFFTSYFSRGGLSNDLGIAFGICYGLGFILLLIWENTRHESGEKLDSLPLSFRSFAQYVPVLLMILNGLCPYLGLKTETSFAMFSNLRTEGGRTNHLFVPNLQVFDFQKHLIQILESNIPVINAMAGKWIPYEKIRILFQENASRRIDSTVRFNTLDGKIGSLEYNGPDMIVERPSRFSRKFFTFRVLKSVDDMGCYH